MTCAVALAGGVNGGNDAQKLKERIALLIVSLLPADHLEH